jgi:hypothetical protein
MPKSTLSPSQGLGIGPLLVHSEKENTHTFCLGSGTALILVGWIPIRIQEGNNTVTFKIRKSEEIGQVMDVLF